MFELSRRQVVKSLAAGLAAAAVPMSAMALKSVMRIGQPGDVEHWVSPLASGVHVGHGWSIGAVTARAEGFVEMILEDGDGVQAQVAVYRRDGQARGLAHTGYLDFVLMNGADGGHPSDEALGLVVMSIAKRAERNERLAVVKAEDARQLISHHEWLSTLA